LHGGQSVIAGVHPPGWFAGQAARPAWPPGLLAPHRVALDLVVPTRAAVFAAIGRMVHQARGPSAQEIADRLARRDSRASTAIGAGLAVPHAHVPQLRRPVAALLRLQTPIAFEAPDGRPVGMLLALLVPRPATAAHLELLSALTGLLLRDTFRQALTRCSEAQQVCELFWQQIDA
jgi:PTS system nitrogen regulatory IIA component